MDTYFAMLEITKAWKKKHYHYFSVFEKSLGRDLEQEVWIEFKTHRKTQNITFKSKWFKKRMEQTIHRVWKRIQRDYQKNFSQERKCFQPPIVKLPKDQKSIDLLHKSLKFLKPEEQNIISTIYLKEQNFNYKPENTQEILHKLRIIYEFKIVENPIVGIKNILATEELNQIKQQLGIESLVIFIRSWISKGCLTEIDIHNIKYLFGLSPQTIQKKLDDSKHFIQEVFPKSVTMHNNSSIAKMNTGKHISNLESLIKVYSHQPSFVDYIEALGQEAEIILPEFIDLMCCHNSKSYLSKLQNLLNKIYSKTQNQNLIYGVQTYIDIISN